MSEKLKGLLENAMGELPRGPNHSAIGQVVEDCALVHMDYLSCVDMAGYFICEAIAEISGETVPEVSARLQPARKCDCSSCAGPEESAKKYAEYQANLLAKLTPEFKDAVATRSED